jgi:glycosyltransferase involved in cell wall biosynthesis
MKNSSFSIIVPAYDVQDYVCKALDSIFAQDYNNFEVIVVDDVSTDDTALKVEEYIAQKNGGGNNEHIKFIKCETNKGTSGACEEGLKIAKNEWILFLDNDD